MLTPLTQLVFLVSASSRSVCARRRFSAAAHAVVRLGWAMQPRPGLSSITPNSRKVRTCQRNELN